MMRIVGIAIITVSIVLVGLIQYIKLKSRPSELELYINILTEYLNGLKWNQKTLKEVVLGFETNEFCDYISETKHLLEENSYLYSFFEGNNKYSHFHLCAEEENILKNFCFQSGNYNLENEIKLCEKTINLLENYKSEAYAKYKKLGLCGIKISLICGIWALILLI